MTSEIQGSEILNTAMRTVGTANQTIYVTMQAVEEMQDPIPHEYFQLLQAKMLGGVKVRRIGFGSSAEFKLLESRVYINNPNYTFYRSSDSDYRRMILVDDSKLMFAKVDAVGRRVFYSEDSELIADYKRYFEDHLLPKGSRKID